ncbi:hypothetical protein Y1Q_0010344 [Alligator mississippiensis]|uniref:Uncharacterized protein n=1 Tax=Alligator mississippiensis TaxID=8496 RepID=A0A151NM65_ALLMI|nr:hypothetical protein Y1Q_0010344 [Alligator mississippiensis]
MQQSTSDKTLCNEIPSKARNEVCGTFASCFYCCNSSEPQAWPRIRLYKVLYKPSILSKSINSLYPIKLVIIHQTHR